MVSSSHVLQLTVIQNCLVLMKNDQSFKFIYTYPALFADSCILLHSALNLKVYYKQLINSGVWYLLMHQKSFRILAQYKLSTLTCQQQLSIHFKRSCTKYRLMSGGNNNSLNSEWNIQEIAANMEGKTPKLPANATAGILSSITELMDSNLAHTQDLLCLQLLSIYNMLIIMFRIFRPRFIIYLKHVCK